MSNCYYCNKRLSKNDKTKDHKTARSLGGHDFITNIVIACNNCNNKKSILEGHLSQLYDGLLARRKKDYRNQFYREFRKRGLDFYISIWIELFKKYNSIISFNIFSYLLYDQEKYDFLSSLSKNNIIILENTNLDENQYS